MPSSRSLAQWLIGITAAAAILIIAIVQWSPASTVRMTYEDAKKTLISTFHDAEPEIWQAMPVFDNSFTIYGAIDPRLSEWVRQPAVGVSLDRDPEHEAAICQFQYRKWSGVLITLRADRFEEVPSQSYVASGQSILMWRSPGGELAYVCIVEEGSTDELLMEILGKLA